MFDPLLSILIYTSEVFELVENILYAYADDSTLLGVVCKPADKHTVAASLNSDLGKILEWCNRWWMILNRKAFMVSRLRTVNWGFHGDLVLSGVSICASPYLACSLTARSPSKTM